MHAPDTFISEGIDALYERLGRNLGITEPATQPHPDWDRAEADASALVDLARTHTKPTIGRTD
jgi:hypothetical protein